MKIFGNTCYYSAAFQIIKLLTLSFPSLIEKNTVLQKQFHNLLEEKNSNDKKKVLAFLKEIIKDYNEQNDLEEFLLILFNKLEIRSTYIPVIRTMICMNCQRESFEYPV